ncbi:MAG: hypothetical protein LBV60_11100 [Streptomyces sp.]|jgi:hypothetical protein|nr:hypothetical protein [Streptomyces sp.]
MKNEGQDQQRDQRPPLRMCVRCECLTRDPVVVHEVHSPSGPGFNIYACPPCAPNYPPLPVIQDLFPRSTPGT